MPFTLPCVPGPVVCAASCAQPCCMGQPSGLDGACSQTPSSSPLLQLMVILCPGFLEGLDPAWLHNLGPWPAFLLVTLQSGVLLGYEHSPTSPFSICFILSTVQSEPPIPVTARRVGRWEHSSPCSLPCPLALPEAGCAQVQPATIWMNQKGNIQSISVNL